MLELKDATLIADGRELFSRLSMVAAEGQLTCVTGPSGKTALAGVLLGFTPLTEGFVSIDGSLLTPQSAPVFRQLMAYVPQERPLVPCDVAADTEGLESVWADGLPDGDTLRRRRMQSLTLASIAAVLPSLTARRYIIADDPAPALADQLLTLAAEGRTVVVLSNRDEYLQVADKIVTLGGTSTTTSSSITV